jgi:hypothetical protein
MCGFRRVSPLVKLHFDPSECSTVDFILVLGHCPAFSSYTGAAGFVMTVPYI